MSDKMKPVIAIVDDHPIVLEGLVKLFNKENLFSAVNHFTSGQALLDFLSNNTVDIILLDIALPDYNGIDLCHDIKHRYKKTIVLAFSSYNTSSAIMGMFENGASGYLLKSAAPREIIACIKTALEGGQVFSEEIRKIIKDSDTPITQRFTSRLSAREMEILKLIAAGNTTAQIAQTLYLSKFTIENHRKNILQKLQVKNVAELMAAAARLGLIGGPDINA